MPRFGIEYTFHAGSHKRAELVVDILRSNFKNAYVDDQIYVEVPTPILSSMTQAKAFHEKLFKAMANKECPVKRTRIDSKGFEVHEMTGGGHIHVELPKDLPRWIDRVETVIKLVGMNPWLTWVFNEFGDNTEALPLGTGQEFRNYLNWGYLPAIGEWQPTAALFKKEQLLSLLTKRILAVCLSSKHPTMEFRFFDAPTSWKQSKEHLDFALAIMNSGSPSYMAEYDRDDDGRFLPPPEDYSRIYTPRRVRKEFKELVEFLGLKWSVYKKYMRNFEDRKNYGKLV